MTKKKTYVYMLECKDKSLYTGYTVNLKKRVDKHQLGKAAKYTRGRTPLRLVYYEVYSSKSQALSREYEIKQLRRLEKIDLIKNFKASILNS